MKAKILLPFATAIIFAPLAHGEPGKQHKTYIDPAEVDADYAVMGEYSGTIDGQKAGAHVIALGEGKFDLMTYAGGLPGDGWDGNKKNRTKASGITTDGVTSFTIGKRVATLKAGTINIQKQPLGDLAGSLQGTARKSPTLGNKAPEGAVVLFDGKNVDAWKPGAKMGNDKLLHQGATSIQEFQNFTLHLEFRTPYKPTARGQARGNSGFYAQGRYEVQILDSFGLDGVHNECGGIYKIAEPKMNMCYPPLAWQTYDIDFTTAEFDAEGKKTSNARMTVKHNGVVIHDDVECTHATTASPNKEGANPGPIYLQNHGNPVRYQNIWVLEK